MQGNLELCGVKAAQCCHRYKESSAGSLGRISLYQIVPYSPQPNLEDSCFLECQMKPQSAQSSKGTSGCQGHWRLYNKLSQLQQKKLHPLAPSCRAQIRSCPETFAPKSNCLTLSIPSHCCACSLNPLTPATATVSPQPSGEK